MLTGVQVVWLPALMSQAADGRGCISAELERCARTRFLTEGECLNSGRTSDVGDFSSGDWLAAPWLRGEGIWRGGECVEAE